GGVLGVFWVCASALAFGTGQEGSVCPLGWGRDGKEESANLPIECGSGEEQETCGVVLEPFFFCVKRNACQRGGVRTGKVKNKLFDSRLRSRQTHLPCYQGQLVSMLLFPASPSPPLDAFLAPGTNHARHL
ncbi:unnamed protein product, partial [Pylaiella littoralis]